MKKDHKKLYIVSVFLWSLLLVVTILFGSTKDFFNFWPGIMAGLKVLRYHSSFIVWTIMVLSIGLTISSTINQLGISFQQFRHHGFRLLVVFSLFLFSVLPIGNKIKYHSFFYESWMWYCAFWIICVCLVVIHGLIAYRSSHPLFPVLGRKFVLVDRFFCNPHIDRNDWLFCGASSLWVLIITYLLGDYALGQIPHVQDSIAQFFQAKVLAHGHFAMPAPAEPEFFKRIYVIVEEGRWYTIYPPGFPLILSIGIALGIPQWVNPTISALILPVFFVLLIRQNLNFAARFGLILFALSPFYLFMGAGFMNHPASLLFLLLFLLCWQEGFRIPSKRSSIFFLFAGVLFGVAFMTRPLTALAFLIAAIIGWGKPILSHLRWSMFGALFFLLGTVPSAMFYLAYNTGTTGHPLLTGYVKYFGGNPLGFGNRPWGAVPLGPKLPNEVYHSPWRGIANTNSQLNGLNNYLLGWPIPSLTLVFLLFLPGLQRVRYDRICILFIFMVLGVYFFYFFQDFCYGPRFVFETVPFCFYLISRGIESGTLFIKGRKIIDQFTLTGFIYPLIGLFFLVAFCTVWVERMYVMSDAYWGADEEIARMVRNGIDEKNAILFVDDAQDYVAVFSFLDPSLEEGWIVAHNLGKEKNRELIDKYPNWPVYRLRLKDTDSPYRFETVLQPYRLDE